MAKEALIEIKKGQVGRGLLIENDGFISLDHPNNKKLRENIEEFKQDLIELPRPFIVYAVFQKYGIENFSCTILEICETRAELNDAEKA